MSVNDNILWHTIIDASIIIKVRKLEFLLADALQKGCDSIITCGSIQSNHISATAVASKQLGLTPHFILGGPDDAVSFISVLTRCCAFFFVNIFVTGCPFVSSLFRISIL